MNKDFQFVYETDIVVCGAGTAGTVAAIAAANEGRKVAIIEQFGAAGGSSSLGLVTPLMHSGIEGNPMCSYIGQEINQRNYKYGGANEEGRAFDPMILTIVLEEMLMEAGIKIFYHSFISDVLKEDKRISGIIVNNKSGRGLIKGKIYIDATGDGDVSYLAGADYESGDEETQKNQPVSLRYVIGGIDLDSFGGYVLSLEDDSFNLEDYKYDTDKSFSTAVTLPDKGWSLLPAFLEAIEKGDLEEEDAIYWQVFGIPGRKDSLAFNCPEFFDHTNALDYEDLTHVQLYGKKAILRQLNFYKKYFPGFEDAYISDIATMVGIRESRRIVTEYFLSAEDILAQKKFKDGIAQSNYPIDVHGRKLKLVGIEVKDDDKPYYEIPYRSLVVKGIDNLLVAGRSIGSDFIAQSAIRIIPTCRSLGEASGIAAAFALEASLGLKDIDGSKIRKHMIDRGAIFD